ncbi:hypothetical protein [Lunatibacter salilacus]|uniref:hypothetical protein n=1 Tax=Lunatibacter salilacus TaxID=2483804 RepID=UPI00131DE9B4|nr:hypothetical protein [Lunatibacter salilacus]
MNETSSTLKISLWTKAQETLVTHIKEVQYQLLELQEASDGEDKNSAGDKYEVGREIINQSRELLDKQLESYRKMQHLLKTVSMSDADKVQEGSLVKLPLGYIWVSVPLGKIELEGVSYQLVSKDSPLIQALWELKAGESGTFRDKKMKVEEVY